MSRDVLHIRGIAAILLLACIGLSGPMHLALSPHHDHAGIQCAHCAVSTATLPPATADLPQTSIEAVVAVTWIDAFPSAFSGANTHLRGPPSSSCSSML